MDSTESISTKRTTRAHSDFTIHAEPRSRQVGFRKDRSTSPLNLLWTRFLPHIRLSVMAGLAIVDHKLPLTCSCCIAITISTLITRSRWSGWAAPSMSSMPVKQIKSDFTTKSCQVWSRSRCLRTQSSDIKVKLIPLSRFKQSTMIGLDSRTSTHHTFQYPTSWYIRYLHLSPLF